MHQSAYVGIGKCSIWDTCPVDKSLKKADSAVATAKQAEVEVGYSCLDRVAGLPDRKFSVMGCNGHAGNLCTYVPEGPHKTGVQGDDWGAAYQCIRHGLIPDLLLMVSKYQYLILVA